MSILRKMWIKIKDRLSGFHEHKARMEHYMLARFGEPVRVERIYDAAADYPISEFSYNLGEVNVFVRDIRFMMPLNSIVWNNKHYKYTIYCYFSLDKFVIKNMDKFELCSENYPVGKYRISYLELVKLFRENNGQ